MMEKTNKNTNEAMNDTMTVEVESFKKTQKPNNDLKMNIVRMKKDEIRYLVDAYYQKQDDRKAKFNQLRSVEQGVDMGGDEESITVLQWLAENAKFEETQLLKMLDEWTDTLSVGKWMKDVVGIGPVITSALIAYFDITKARHYNSFISYAGLNDQNVPWLGATKAADVVKSIYTKYDVIIDLADTCLSYACEDYDVDMGTLKKEMIKLAKTFPYQNDLYILAMPVLKGDEDLEDVEELLDSKQVTAITSFKKKISHHKNVLSAFDEFIRDNLKENIEANHNYAKYQYEDGYTAFCDLCHYYMDSDIATSGVVKIASIETNRLESSIINGMQIVIDSTKNKTNKKVAYKKEELKSYLAKPPYNIDLKVLCWKIGDSFVKRSNHKDSLYGKLYKERKAYELQKNERGDYAEQAKRCLAAKNYKDKETIATYSSGKLPLGHIENRARRWAVSIFISHVFEAMYIDFYHKAPPKIYAIAHLGHSDYIAPEVPYAKYMDVPDEYYEMYPELKYLQDLDFE